MIVGAPTSMPFPVRIDAPLTIEVLVLRMTAIIVDVDQRIFTNDPAQLDPLRPLRLKMAGAITSFQFALNERLVSMHRENDPRRDDLHNGIAAWSILAGEFRAFAACNQSITPLLWHEYVPAARVFIRKFQRQIRSIAMILALKL